MTLRLPEAEYRVLCHEVLKRDGWKCRSCDFRGSLHVHHLCFRSQGGPDEAWNLCVLCNTCHTALHQNCKDGVMGLTVVAPANANEELVFIRRPDWRPK